MKGSGAVLILLIGIGVVYLATTGRFAAVIAAVRGKAA